MPPVRRAAPPEQPPPPNGAAAASGAAAARAAVPATVAGVAPAATGAAGGALSAAVVGAATRRIIEGLLGLLRSRSDDVYYFTVDRVTQAEPDIDRSEILELARLERDYEQTFQRKVVERLNRDLPRALRTPDEAERRRAVEAVLTRERRFLEQREQAMLNRSLAAAELVHLRELSPQGAYWKLSEGVKEHTLDCLAMGEKFWPWSVLKRLHPPMHHGCPCRLFGLEEAKSEGWMTDRDIPDRSDAERRARQVERLVHDLEEAGVTEQDVLEHLLALEEDAPYPMGEGDRVRTAHGDLSLGPVTGTITALGSDPDDGVVTHDVQWDDGTASLGVRGSRLRCVTILEAAERWGKGTTKGGQFRPRRGGDPGRPTLAGIRGRGLKRLLPRVPHPPTRRRGEGRWVHVRGQLTKVPEERWEKKVDGITFTSPAGGTNVYREGKLVSEAGGTPKHPDVAKPPRGRERRLPEHAPLDARLRDALNAARGVEANSATQAAQRAARALRRGDPTVAPADPGDGAEAITGLEHAGFRVTATPPDGSVRLQAPDGSTVHLAFDRGRVTAVDWRPAPPEQTLRVASDGAPRTFDAFRADALAHADQLAKTYGARVHLRAVITDPELGDHAGAHGFDGVARLGPDAQADIERSGSARAEGRPLIDEEARGIYAANVVAAHELAHGVNPIGSEHFTGASANLEEALAEEVAHPLAVTRLTEQGQHDVVAWAEANPDALPVTGLYRPERAALASLLDDAGLAGDARTQAVFDLKFRTPPEHRLDALASMLKDAGKFDTLDRARDHVELTLEHPPAVDEHDAPTALPPEGAPVASPAAAPDSLPAGEDSPSLSQSLSRSATAPAADVDVERLGALAGPVTAAIAQRALSGDQGARWELAQRHAMAPGSPAGRLIEHLLPAIQRDIPPVTPPVTLEAPVAPARRMRSHTGLQRVAPLAGPDVGVRLDSARDGELNQAPGPFGHGAYFTSGADASQEGGRARHAYPAGVRLTGADLYRLRDSTDGHMLQATLADVDRAMTSGDGLEELAQRLPAGADGRRDLDRALTILQARPSGTEAMQALGYDGVDARHLPDWDTQDTGSVLYEPRTGDFDVQGDIAPTHLVDAAGAQAFLADPPPGGWAGIAHHTTTPETANQILAGGFAAGHEIHASPGSGAGTGVRLAVRLENPARDPGDGHQGHDGVVTDAGVIAFSPDAVRVVEPVMPSPAAGGAVVGGRAGRWVWIRGAYRHIPHADAWEETADGVTFNSPENSTFVYRRVGNAPAELVAKPRWNGHPDVRNPNRGGTTRGATIAPPGPPPPAPEPPPAEAVDLPEPGWQVRVTPADGSPAYTAIVQRVEDDQRTVRVELANGEHRNVPATTLTVVDRGLPTPQIGPLISEEGWNAVVNRAGVPQADGELTPGVYFQRGLPHPMSPAHIEHAIIVGPQFFASAPGGRAFQLRRGMGFGLFEAIHRDDLARQTIANLWTNGKFTSEHEGRSTSLDRFSTAEGVAQAYARLLGPEWDKDAAIWPDVMRRVALEAHARGYELPADRLAWALGADIGGPGVRPPATEGARLAERLAGLSDGEARDLVNAEGFHSTGGHNTRTAVYRKFADGKVITVAWRRPVAGDGAVTDAQGTDYEFDPAVQPDPADATAALAHRLRGMPIAEARSQLDDWTLVAFSRPYGGIQREGYAKGDRVIWLSTVGTYTPQAPVSEARPDFADPNTLHELRQRALATNPGLASADDQPAALVQAARRGGWQIVQGGAATDEWWTLEKISNPNSDAVTVEQWRYRLQDGRVSEVGRPSETDAGIGTDLGYQVTAARRAEALRTAHREQRARIDALREQIRTRVNAGGEPFNGTEDYADVRLALRELGYSAGTPRNLQGGGQSITYKNADRRAKLIVRVGPDVDGVRTVQARTRVEGGAQDLGRVRVTGRVPVSQAEYHADMLGRADELGARHPGSHVDLRKVKFATTATEPEGVSDHAGWHRSLDGMILLGKDAWPDLQRLIASRNAGQELTTAEKRRIYATYHLMQHEVAHAVGTGPKGYSDNDGGRGMEEALTEELSHIEALDWLSSHGLDEVVEEANRNRSLSGGLWPWRGTYLTDRQNLRGLLERAGAPDDPAERLALFRRWKYEMSGEQRKRELAGMIARREGIPEDAALLVVRRRMAGNIHAGTRNVRGFRAILTPPGTGDPSIGRDALERRGYVRGSGIVGPEGQAGVIVGYSGPGPRLEVRLEGAVNTRRIPLGEIEGRWRLTGPSPTRDPEPPTVPTDAPTNVSTLRVRDRVRVTPVRGRAFQGRIIEIGQGDHAGFVKVKKIGRGEEVWAPERHTRRLDGTGGPPPPPPPPGDAAPPPGAPPATARPTATLNNGGKVAAGAKVRGRVSRQLSTVLAVQADGRVMIRRQDGSEYPARPDELDAVVITNEGRELKKGDHVRTADGSTGEISAIDWTDPQAPKVRIGAEPWYAGRDLKPAVAQPITTADGQTFQIGDRARTSEGQLVEITGQRVLRWPEPKIGITFRAVDTGVDDTIEDSPGALRAVGQPPTIPPNVRPPSSLVERLGNMHYRRQGSARNTAQAVAKPISEAIAADLQEWWAAKGLETRRPGGSAAGTPKRPVYRGRATPPDAVFSSLYRDLFTSEAEHDAARDSNPRLYEMAKGLAAQASLPWPNWQERVAPGPPTPPTPEGSMFDEAVLRHAWTGTFGANGYTTRLTNVYTGDRTAGVIGDIYNRNGTKVGNFQRSVSLNAAGEPQVYHALLKIHRRYRGGGFATMFNRHAEGVYRAKGVKAVTVSANIDVGGYAWGATGFDWNLEPDGTPEAKAKARARKARQMYEAKQYSLTAEERALVEAKLWDGVGPLEAHHIQHAWQLAHLGPEHSIGKKIMLGSSWGGIKHLVGPERSPFAG